MEELENKYIDLILNKCIHFEQAKSLMIHCDFKEHVAFAEKVKQKANQMGIFDVCIHVNDLDDIHSYLMNTDVDDITVNPLIDKTDWNTYALKGAALLFLNSTVPGLMDDIPGEKISKWITERENTIKYYRANVSKYIFPWCIVALPNERWAKKIFPNEQNSYEKLYLNILKMCMIDKENPIKSWEEYIKTNNKYKDRLNELKTTLLHYTNSLGTDLYIEKPADNLWINLDKNDASGHPIISNMPSYEIFTSPNKYKTNGIVYASRPLVYNDVCINNFSLTFENGKVVRVVAENGQDILEKMIFDNPGGCYLGEIALVPHNSPISNTGIIFNETLFDENASCHLALGDGFYKAVPDFNNKTSEDFEKLGLNKSTIHTDFMIGTSDLSIEADTIEGKKLIFKNGNFNL